MLKQWKWHETYKDGGLADLQSAGERDASLSDRWNRLTPTFLCRTVLTSLTFIRHLSETEFWSRDQHMQPVCVDHWSLHLHLLLSDPQQVLLPSADHRRLRMLEEYKSSHQDGTLTVLILTSHVLVTCSIPDFTSRSNTRRIFSQSALNAASARLS